ncbi:aspartic peptidase domain-containing protein [Chiua virens]|nr:aspartic peptidase domain-containing protein [Chiua virens]
MIELLPYILLTAKNSIMSSVTNLITQGAQFSLRRAPRRVKTHFDEDGMSVFDSDEFAYLVYIDIGGQDFWVTFDTGSSDLWVISSNCTTADCQGVVTYSPSASSTLRLSNIDFRLFYLIGSVEGAVATDMVTLGSIRVVSQTFALANKTNDLFLATTGNSGILGLSFPPAAAIRSTVGTTLLDNLFSHLSESDRFFAFKLGRNSTLGDPIIATSSFTIGKLDPSVVDPVNGMAELAYFPVFKSPSGSYDYWKFPIQSLTINGSPLPLSTSLVVNAPAPIGILDTGTTLILGPTPDVNAFWESVGTGGSTRYNMQTNLWEVRCNRAVDVRFVFGEGDDQTEYAVHPEDISWAEGKSKDGWCMGGVQINDGVNSGDWLLGDVFLRNVYVVHHGATSSKPPLIGLLSLTDPPSALTDFQNMRGSDPAPAPSVVERSSAVQWTENAKIGVAVSAIGGFVVGGLITGCYKMRRRSRRASVRR